MYANIFEDMRTWNIYIYRLNLFSRNVETNTKETVMPYVYYRNIYAHCEHICLLILIYYVHILILI